MSNTDLVLYEAIEWQGGGHADADECLDYYDSGERATGYCPRCGASEKRGHHPGCEIAFSLGRATVTEEQARQAKETRKQAQWLEERREKQRKEAEWQAHLDTLTSEKRAEEERKRADARERARDMADSMDRMMLYGAEPNPLTKLMSGIKASMTTNVQAES